MAQEAYVSYKIAKLLKEKGFDEKVFTYYEDEVLKDGFWFEWNRSPLGHIAAPTNQMACAWLRGKGIFFCVHPDYPISKNYMVEFYDDGVPSGLFGDYEKYEDAVEAALKYTLENLI